MRGETQLLTPPFHARCKQPIVTLVNYLLRRHRTISVPFPTHRLALCVLRAIEVDAELSPLVRRSFTLIPRNQPTNSVMVENNRDPGVDRCSTVLCTVYRATTHRMLRVATNGFMESLALTLAIMEELDIETATR